MLTSRFRALLLPVLLLALAACAAMGSRELSREERSTVQVENRSFNDVVVYALRSSQRIRLGLVPAVSTRTFTVPRSMVGGGRPVRFQTDPIGSSRTSVSHEISVRTGEEVQMVIPPS